MLTRNTIKFILSLQKKKTREELKLFVIEGDKLIREFLNSDFRIFSLVAKPEFISGLQAESRAKFEEIIPVSYDELKKISTLVTPHNALAVVRMTERKFSPAKIFRGFSLALDSVQDPGNLGTIIRASAWFGIQNIICTENSVDVYNPKVIQATMGAFINVNVFYTDLENFLKNANLKGIPVYGAMLDGADIQDFKPSGNGIILLGNESKGISEDLVPYITDRIVISKKTEALTGVDSLNLGMAASIILYDFTGKMPKNTRKNSR